MEFSPALQSSRAMIGRWSVDHYLSLLRWPLLVGMGVVFGLVWTEQSNTILFGVTGAIILGLAWLGTQRNAQRIEILTLGFLAGLGLGFAAALASLILTPGFIAAINLIAQSLWTAIAAALLSTSLMLIRRLLTR